MWYRDDSEEIMIDTKATIEQFVEAAAARQPTPGGGSVAALVGALAASMGEMVVNYSIGKKDLAQYESQLKSALAELTKARRMLLELVVEDQAAYEALRAAKKMPANTPERLAAETSALAIGISVPQAIAATAVSILDLADAVVPMANIYLLADLSTCGDLAMATVRSALGNVRVNMKDIADATERGKIEALSDRLISRATTIIQRMSPRIWQRIERGV